MWNKDERVLARPEAETYWYPGTIRYVDDERCYVVRDDQEDGWFAGPQLRPLNLPPGTAIECDLPCDGTVGVIEQVHGSEVDIRVADGAVMTMHLARLRIPDGPASKALSCRAWKIGDRVFARWGGDLFWYPGTILRESDGQFHVLFDDQDQGTIPPSDLIPLRVEEGDAVFCRPKFEPALRYFPAVVQRVADEVIDVLFDHIEEEECSTTVSRLRIRRDSGRIICWEEGERVLISGRDEYWYPGIVLSIDGDRTFVSYFTGFHGWMKPDEIRRFRLTQNTRIECRRRAEAEYVPALLLHKENDLISVRYDDGESEQTVVRLIRIPNSSRPI